jgi:DNA polymerase (family 10)
VVNYTFSTRITNEAIADRLRSFARLLAIRSEDFYRIRAYDDAASIIASWPNAISEIAKREGAKGLRTIPGVGRSISEKIVELVNTGTFESWEKLTMETPVSVLDLLDVPGIGIKTAGLLHQRFKISTTCDLRKFVEGGGLELVDGLDDKRASDIRQFVAQHNAPCDD